MNSFRTCLLKTSSLLSPLCRGTNLVSLSSSSSPSSFSLFSNHVRRATLVSLSSSYSIKDSQNQNSTFLENNTLISKTRSYARVSPPSTPRSRGRAVRSSRALQLSKPQIIKDTKQSIINAESNIDPSLLATGDEVLTSESPSAHILDHAAIIINRNIEMMNLLLGFEQANKYAMRDPLGNPIGFIVEEDSFFHSLLRQVFRLHRKFTALVLDINSEPVLKIHRPFTLINSTIYVQDHNGKLIGFVRQRWHLWRRKYDLYLADYSAMSTSTIEELEKATETKISFDVSKITPLWSQVPHFKFGTIDMPFLSWIFDVRGQKGELLARIDKDFTGFAREIFTDARQYALKMDMLESDIPRNRPLYYDERAVALACAITIDHDYFSLHSGGPGMFPMFWLFSGSHSGDE